MTTHQLHVFSNPVDGREDEYNQWYDEIHVREVLQVPGFVSAQRFRVGAELIGSSPHRYLAIYEFQADDPAVALAELGRAASSMDMNEAFDQSTAVAIAFTPIGERMMADAPTRTVTAQT